MAFFRHWCLLLKYPPLLPSHLICVSFSRKPSRLSWVAPLPKLPVGTSGLAMTSHPHSLLCRNTAPPVDQELREARGLSHPLAALPQPWPELNQGPTALHIPAGPRPCLATCYSCVCLSFQHDFLGFYARSRLFSVYPSLGILWQPLPKTWEWKLSRCPIVQ